MVPKLFAVAVVLRTGKFIKKAFERGENLLQNVYYYTLCLDSINWQKSRWKVKIYVDEKPTF